MNGFCTKTSEPVQGLGRSVVGIEPIGALAELSVMGEFFRSGAIVTMGLIVIGAGIFVVFHNLSIG